MRKRKELLEEQFINSSSAEKFEKSVSHPLSKSVSLKKWPFDNEEPSPSLGEGSNLKKPISVYTSEREHNTINSHVELLGVSKNKWIMRAIFKALAEEQRYLNSVE